MKVTRKLTAALTVAAVLTSLAGVATADVVQNVGTVQIAGDDTVTIPSGGSASVGYYIEQGGQGGLPACDATVGSPATVTPTVPAGVTATPSSLSFSSCGSSATQSISFSSSTPGTFTIPVTVSDSAGEYNTNPAQFKLIVQVAPANTPPVLTVPANITVNGSTIGGAVVNYSASATDAQDGALVPVCSPASGSLFPVGVTTVNCSVTDSGTLTDSDSFTVTVVNTAPTVTVAGVTAGADYNKGFVPAATCNVVDTEDGNSSFAATLSSISGPYTSDGIGSQTASCSYTDGGGVTATDAVGYNIVDPSAPAISYTLTPVGGPDGDNGWYVSDVIVDWTVTEPESPNSLSTTGCVDQNITADQALTTYSCSASSAGGPTGPVAVSIKRDATAPTAAASASPAPNANGWNNTDVTVSFAASNAEVSGLDSCTADVVVSAETPAAGEAVGGTCTDLAGNVSDAATATVKLDKTDPTVARVGGPAAQTYYIGLDTLPSAPTCSIQDELSGPDAGSCVANGFSTAPGTHTVSVTGSDLAGNDATSDSLTYTIANLTLNGFYQPVDMDKLNTVKGGSTVPLKFEVFAGPTELTSTSVVDTFRAFKTDCAGTPLGTDDIEQYTSGSTVLRYDSTGGQFIQNWQTPKGAGICYHVVLTFDGGSTIEADFKTK